MELMTRLLSEPGILHQERSNVHNQNSFSVCVLRRTLPLQFIEMPDNLV